MRFMKILKHHPYEILLTLLIVVYAAVFSYMSVLRMYTFNSHYFDLGIMNQVSYNTAQGRFLEMTNQELERNTSRVAIHFDPLLALFAPFYYLYNGSEVLLVGQAVLIALGAIPMYLLALHVIKKKPIALLFACMYLLYFPVQRMTLFDFHAVTVALPLLLAMIYLAMTKRYAWSILCMGIALLTKENVGLVTFMIGLYFFLFRKDRAYGLVTMAISAIVFVAAVFVIIPHYRQAEHFALRYFGDYGDTPGKIILGIFQHPLVTLQKAFTPENGTYLRRLLMGNGLIMLAAPFEFLLSLPDLLIILLSTNTNMKSIYFHYSSVVVVFVFFSAVMGYARISKYMPRIYANIILITVIVFNVWSMYLYNPLPNALVSEPLYLRPYNAGKVETVKRWQRELADDVKVASTPQLGPFFSSRRYYYNFLFDPSFYSYGIPEDDIIREIDNYEKADYVIIAKSELHEDNKLLKRFYDHLRGNQRYVLVDDKDDIQVYRRV